MQPKLGDIKVIAIHKTGVKTRAYKYFIYDVCPECKEVKWIPKKNKFCSHSCANSARKIPTSLKHKNINAYSKYHQRLKRKRGKAIYCINGCKKGPFEWANLSGDYKNIMDYEMMCRSCHAKYDIGRIKDA